MAKPQGAEITRIKTMRTPKGIAAFAYLGKPDTSFGKTRYRITIFFDKADPEFVEFVKAVRAEAKTLKLDPKKSLPFKVANEKTAKASNVEVGTPYLEFASNAEDKPGIPVFNAANQQEDGVFVYGGDVVRVEGTLAHWSMTTGQGLKFYLRAVQLLQSNWNGDAGSTFESEDEFLKDDEESPEAKEDDSLEEEDFDLGDEETSEESSDDDEDPLAGLV